MKKKEIVITTCIVRADQQWQVFGRRGIENSTEVLRDQSDIDEKGKGSYRRLREER